MKVDERTVGLALRELAEHTQPSASPVAAIMQRGQRARRIRTGALTGAGAGLAAIAIAAVSVVGLGQPHRAAHAPVTAQMRLAAAMEATGQSSFRLGITLSDANGHYYRAVSYTGAYDPVTRNGYLSGDKETGIWAQRIVGGQLYVQQGPDDWLQYGDCGRGFYFDNLKTGDGGTLSSAGLSANPTRLMDLLRPSGTVTELGRQGSGADAVDRFRFVAAVQVWPPGATRCGQPTAHAGPPVTTTLTGVAEVGVHSGKVSAITYQEPMLEPTGTGPHTFQPSSKYAIKIAIRMSDYGLPVAVKPPALPKPTGG
jgi:hypothetical protein